MIGEPIQIVKKQGDKRKSSGLRIQNNITLSQHTLVEVSKQCRRVIETVCFQAHENQYFAHTADSLQLSLPIQSLIDNISKLCVTDKTVFNDLKLSFRSSEQKQHLLHGLKKKKWLVFVILFNQILLIQSKQNLLARTLDNPFPDDIPDHHLNTFWKLPPTGHLNVNDDYYKFMWFAVCTKQMACIRVSHILDSLRISFIRPSPLLYRNESFIYSWCWLTYHYSATGNHSKNIGEKVWHRFCVIVFKDQNNATRGRFFNCNGT